ncbi:MAG: glucuronate isomerase [Acidobacteriota bacterium]
MSSNTLSPTTATNGLQPDEILPATREAFASTLVLDIHTHLFSPQLGSLGLWGIDNLVTYHYLEAEVFRCHPIQPAQYWTLSVKERADLIWDTLFVKRAPVSEACRGVIHVLQAFGLDTNPKTLAQAREFFASREIDAHISDVFRLAGMEQAVMTNDPLDPAEAPLWKQGISPDPRFHPVLRLDRILNGWANNWQALVAEGYEVDAQAGGRSVSEVRRFLSDWFKRMAPVYMACSLPDTFAFPEESVRGKLLAEAILPACREFGIPMSLMIGVRYLVNPELRLAGDASGRADLRALERILVRYPDNRFLVSLLSRENQHELCVYARKFRNMLPFGCWWFLNNPSVVEEMTRERLEMLGTTFVPQHSDARVLEQVIYKWRNSRRTIAPILAESYRLLQEDGGVVTRDNIQQDVSRFLKGNAREWIGA